MKLCIAGLSSFKTEVLKNPPDFCLESFYSFQDWQIPLIKQCDFFLLDSGAFSFMNTFKGRDKVNYKEFKEYLDRYIEFINKYNVKYFFELDLDVIVEYDFVLELREKLENETGKKSIPVFHINRRIDGWKDMCKNYNFVAIAGSGKNDTGWMKNTTVIKKLIKIADRNNCKVHGLGYTRKNVEKLGFYSVDSTSWIGVKYGKIYRYRGCGNMETLGFKNRRLKNYHLAVENNLQQWIRYQRYLYQGKDM